MRCSKTKQRGETNALKKKDTARHAVSPPQPQHGPGHESRNRGHRLQRALFGIRFAGDAHAADQHRITVSKGPRIASAVRAACALARARGRTRVARMTPIGTPELVLLLVALGGMTAAATLQRRFWRSGFCHTQWRSARGRDHDGLRSFSRTG